MSGIDIDAQERFYKEEFRELEFEAKKILDCTALSLYQNGDSYIGLFKGLDEKRGNVFIDIKNEPGDHTPRLESAMNCYTLASNRMRTAQWADITHLDLIRNREVSNCYAVDYVPSRRAGWITMLVRGLEFRFIESLTKNQVLLFGPTIPPFEYLRNLRDFTRLVKPAFDSSWARILLNGFPIINSRKPELLTEESDIPQNLIDLVRSHEVLIFQGPPGTGKTFQIADLVSRLIGLGNSVLLTAQTNRSAIEVCEKQHLKPHIVQGNVSKRPYSHDEAKRFPGLLHADELIPRKGHLHITTYYQFSRTWSKLDKAYDYIMVEEASQAYLTTIAGALKVGKHVVVVGDPKQIVTIVTSKENRENSTFFRLVNGMSAMSEVSAFPFVRKTESRRLPPRAVRYTNCFYENTMVSMVDSTALQVQLNTLDILREISHPDGGPTLIQFTESQGGRLKEMTDFLVVAINELAAKKTTTIAVLTPYIATLTELQKSLKTRTKSKRYIVETVDRVQGLDVDYVFYVAPESSAFTFDTNRFNVATSRSKVCTYILVADDFDQVVQLPNGVGQYLSQLKEEFSFKSNEILC